MSGVFGIYDVEGRSVADEIFVVSTALQHRGEAGCGVTLEHKGKFYTEKDRRLVYDFFIEKTNGLRGLREMAPRAAIGHTLYEDTGGLQPVEEPGENHVISLAMDGILLGFMGKNDSMMRALFSRYLDDSGNFYSAIERLMDKLNGRGSYCVTSLVRNQKGMSLVAFRDPKGIKPYCLGKKDSNYVIASETKALEAIEAEFLKDIEPGEVIVVSDSGLESKVLRQEKHSHCFFEWIYFADPISTIEGRSVYEARKELGRMLARRYLKRVENIDIVMASPDSGRGVALGFQQELSSLTKRFVPYEEAAVKNPGAKRTFQVEDEEKRGLAARIKFFINQSVVRGKKVAVGDDSIVRGTVFKKGMIEKLRQAGAVEIIPIISCPALLHACIKDPRGTGFAAYGLRGNIEEIGEQVAKKIGADFVCYPTTQEMVESIGLEDLCKACINGVFPVNEEFWR
jgi:amidophosphoribosyltransferase